MDFLVWVYCRQKLVEFLRSVVGEPYEEFLGVDGGGGGDKGTGEADERQGGALG